MAFEKNAYMVQWSHTAAQVREMFDANKRGFVVALNTDLTIFDREDSGSPFDEIYAKTICADPYRKKIKAIYLFVDENTYSKLNPSNPNGETLRQNIARRLQKLSKKDPRAPRKLFFFSFSDFKSAAEKLIPGAAIKTLIDGLNMWVLYFHEGTAQSTDKLVVVRPRLFPYFQEGQSQVVTMWRAEELGDSARGMGHRMEKVVAAIQNAASDAKRRSPLTGVQILSGRIPKFCIPPSQKLQWGLVVSQDEEFYATVATLDGARLDGRRLLIRRRSSDREWNREFVMQGFGERIFLTRSPRSGAVECVVRCLKLGNNESPASIILLGSAASLAEGKELFCKKHRRVGGGGAMAEMLDVVVPLQVWAYDYRKLWDNAPPRNDGRTYTLSDWGPVDWGAIQRRLRKFSLGLNCFKCKKTYSDYTLHFGGQQGILSGNVVVASEEIKVKLIKSTENWLPKGRAVEMEAEGLAAAVQGGLLVNGMVIKGISDYCHPEPSHGKKHRQATMLAARTFVLYLASIKGISLAKISWPK